MVGEGWGVEWDRGGGGFWQRCECVLVQVDGVMADEGGGEWSRLVPIYEGPPSPDYVPGPEEPEQAPPSPIYIPFVPEPVYPEFLPVDDEVFPAEEQPLPAADSPTHQSPGYIPESDPEESLEEDDDEDPEEDQPTIRLTEEM
ncbi:hypothetical protein Tco_0875106 [Tanacetum coccineum]|uniref:Uncharacterized protein n=1 Tax=Tanacetum coccineum TaxID=301880 RepID=A0ABQ5BNP7_9ASTR